MGGDWRQWVKNRGLEKWFRRDNLIILVLAGILLFVIALPTRDDRKDDGAAGAETGKTTLTLAELRGTDGGEAGDSAAPETDTDEQYVIDMEKRLTDALSRMADVGEVQVMITLKASRELVVEKEQPVSRSSTNENDAQGGSRIVNQLESEENTVYRTDGSVSEPYVVKTLSPQIEGVLVVAEGAGSGTVNRTIVEIAQALFGVEAHKVKVVKMEGSD